MGRTPKPLTILVHPDLLDTAEVKALAGKGHTVTTGLTLQDGPDLVPFYWWTADIVIGPNCWRMGPELLPYLDLAIKGARGVRYPIKGKKA